ncbi:MAG TPA: hypothetical protein PLR50_09115 [Candidatus Rifleibacterium sp.]|jgi:hypothetical protein|nr:hypothetical protein [Candidatus Rifleibacterium sp.]HPW59138.1 hypothetical protein [Candidatus Rifleibacterium sp.]HQB83644.1 hypothetical protein [Candidatus Rifleibacterium sp.]
MRNFLAVFLLLSVFSLLADLFAEEQFALSDAAVQKSRTELIEQLFLLDLPAICADEERLSDLGAGYDRDNRQYFLERPAHPDGFSDSGYLITIDFSDARSLIITVFAPQDVCYQWLQIRPRICNGRLTGRPVFQPDGCAGDLLDFGSAGSDQPFFQVRLADDN